MPGALFVAATGPLAGSRVPQQHAPAGIHRDQLWARSSNASSLPIGNCSPGYAPGKSRCPSNLLNERRFLRRTAEQDLGVRQLRQYTVGDRGPALGRPVFVVTEGGQPPTLSVRGFPARIAPAAPAPSPLGQPTDMPRALAAVTYKWVSPRRATDSTALLHSARQGAAHNTGHQCGTCPAARTGPHD